MICIMLELGGHSVLKRIKSKYLLEIVERIKTIFQEHRLSKCQEEGGFFLFTFQNPESMIYQLRGMLDQVEKLFEIEREILQGNLIYVDVATTADMRSNFDRIKSHLIKITEDKGLFFSPSFKEDYFSLILPKDSKEGNFEKSLYGMTISQKRNILYNIIIYSRIITLNILNNNEVLEVITPQILNLPVYKNVLFDPFDALNDPLEQIDFAKIKNELGYQASDVSQFFSSLFYGEILKKIPENIENYAFFFIKYGFGECRLPGIFYFAKVSCLNYNLELSRDIESTFLASNNSRENIVSLNLVNLMIRFYQALICCDHEEVLSVQGQLLELEEVSSFYLQLEKKLALADCLLTLRYPTDSLKYVKEVMHSIVEKSDYKWFLANSNYIIAHSMLHKEKVSEADIYFTFTMESTHTLSWTALDCLSSISRASIAFLRGAFDVAFAHLDRTRKDIESEYLSPLFSIYFLFIEARIFFELGNYDIAKEKFEKLIQLSNSTGHSVGIELYKAWQARSLIFLGEIDNAILLLERLRPSVENNLYLAEAYYFKKDYEKALIYLEAIDDFFPSKNNFISPYINLFRSGFVNFEDRVIRYKDDSCSIQVYVLGFKTLVMALLGDDSFYAGYKNKVRNELKSEGDPSSRLFCFFLAAASLALNSYETHLDQLTMLNRSLKYLNEYSGRTLKPTLRMNFLKNNYWNIQIIEMAKKLKLLNN